MNKIKISSYGIMMLTFFLSISFFNPYISSIILKTTYNDSWISMSIGFILGLIILKILLKINLISDKNIIDRSNTKLINFILIILLFILSSSILIKTTTFISNNYLNNYNILIISIITLLVIVYAVIKGIEPIIRTCQILFCISILLNIIYLIMLCFYFDITNILPIFNHNIKDILISSIYYLIFSIIPIILISIIPKYLISDNNYNKYIIIGYVISFIYNIINILITIFSSNNFIIENFEYPMYFIMNKIQYFNFIERLDNLFMLPNIFSIFIFLIISLLFINEYIKNIFKIKKDNIYVLSLISILIILLSFSFKIILI